MKIPKKFNIYGHTIHVKLDKDLSKRKRYGQADLEFNVLRINPIECQKSIVEETFCHELMHFILLHATHGKSIDELKNGNKIYYDENLVESAGEILHQVLTTFNGELKNKKWIK